MNNFINNALNLLVLMFEKYLFDSLIKHINNLILQNHNYLLPYAINWFKTKYTNTYNFQLIVNEMITLFESIDETLITSLDIINDILSHNIKMDKQDNEYLFKYQTIIQENKQLYNIFNETINEMKAFIFLLNDITILELLEKN